MSRLLDARPLWRATLLLTLATCLSVTGAAPLSATAQDDARRQQRRTEATQRGEPQDPDERAARGEIPEAGDDTSSAGAATLLLTPSTLVARPGQRVRLTLSILGAEDLRRLPVTVRFDPKVVEIASVSLGSAWEARQQPVLLHDISRPGELVVGLGQIARDETGISGSAELLDLELTALAVGDAAIVLQRFAAIGAGSRPQDTVALTANVVVR